MVNSDFYNEQLIPIMGEHIFGLNTDKTPEEIEEIICQYFLDEVENKTPKWMFNEFDSLFILGAKASNRTIQKYLDKLILAEEEAVFCHTMKRCCFILLNNWKTIRNYDYCERLITFLNGVKSNIVIPQNPEDKIRIRWIIRFLKSDEYEAMQKFAGQHIGGSASFAKHIQSVPSSQIKTNINKTEYVEYLKHKYSQNIIASYLIKAQQFNEKSLDKSYKNIKNDLYNYIFQDIESHELFEIIQDKIYQDIDSYYEDEQDKIWDDNLALRTFNKIIDKLTISKEKSPSSVFMCLITQGNLSIWILILIKIILACPHSNKYLDHCITNLIEYYRQSSTFDFEWLINMLASVKRFSTVELYKMQKDLMTNH